MGTLERARRIIAANMSDLLNGDAKPNADPRSLVVEIDQLRGDLRALLTQLIRDRRACERERDTASEDIERWQHRAEAAIRRGRDDLAREALARKLDAARSKEQMDQDVSTLEARIISVRKDVASLEAKGKRVKAIVSSRTVPTPPREYASDDIYDLIAHAELEVDPLEIEFEKLAAKEIDLELAEMKKRVAERKGEADRGADRTTEPSA